MKARLDGEISLIPAALVAGDSRIIAGGKHHMRRAEIKREGPRKRPVLIEHTVHQRKGRPPRDPRRSPLLLDRPHLFFDLNLIAPLIRFGRDGFWHALDVIQAPSVTNRFGTSCA